METAEAMETWEKLEIKDDFLFAKVMRDKKICRMLLEKLLQIEIKDIVYLEEQKTLAIGKDAKSVRLDVYLEEGDRVFDLEMQTTNKRNLPKRSRYYQGMIDLNTIEKGESYKKLKESYVVFICTFDPFYQGKAQYTFENLCLENKGLRLGDGTRKVFFNANGYIHAENEEVREFLKYVNGGTSKHPFIKAIEDKVVQVKTNKEWRLEYMTLLMREEEIREESSEVLNMLTLEYNEEVAKRIEREEAREEGREEGIKGTVSVLKELNIPLQTILVKIQEQYNLSSEAAEKYL